MLVLSAFLPTAVWGVLISLEQRRRAIIWAEALYNYSLLSYPIMTESILAGICACGMCWFSARPATALWGKYIRLVVVPLLTDTCD